MICTICKGDDHINAECSLPRIFRRRVATAALQGILPVYAYRTTSNNVGTNAKEAAKAAVECADELIAELEKKK